MRALHEVESGMLGLIDNSSIDVAYNFCASHGDLSLTKRSR